MRRAFANAYAGKRVFVTGHTGFKGTWLCEWLLALGAEVTGYSLPSPAPTGLSDKVGLPARVQHLEGDILDAPKLRTAVAQARPDFVFHLAAQPLVRASYADPVRTFDVNVMGTVQVLDALRAWAKPCAVVCITTDKCYENREWLYGYREEDPLGGHDPYSASKAAAEIVIASYRKSFFTGGPVRVASARAGNVIGGGDWAADRIVPDCIRALSAGQPITVRNRQATRPWQHVLEPLSGYLWLGACLATSESFAGAFNFGPSHDADRTVEELVTELLRHWPGRWEDHGNPKALHEAGRLQLATDKAHALLGWSPAWRFPEAVGATVSWYRAAQGNFSADGLRNLTQHQIRQYTESARAASLRWAIESVS